MTQLDVGQLNSALAQQLNKPRDDEITIGIVADAAARIVVRRIRWPQEAMPV